MSLPLRDRLGALQERDFRLLFAGTTVTSVGDRLGGIRELREGWSEFASRSWLWASVGLFGISNLAWVGSWSVLGPAIAKEDLGGAGGWAAVLTVGGVGAVAGGLVALRLRPGRPLLVSCLAPLPMLLPLAALALKAPVPILAAAAFASQAGLAVHLALWFTVFQREVPERAQSRVSSYDALGSFVLIPLGTALVGPVSAGIGAETTLWGSLVIGLVCILGVVALPSVRAIRAPSPIAEIEPIPA